MKRCRNVSHNPQMADPSCVHHTYFSVILSLLVTRAKLYPRADRTNTIGCTYMTEGNRISHSILFGVQSINSAALRSNKEMKFGDILSELGLKLISSSITSVRTWLSTNSVNSRIDFWRTPGNGAAAASLISISTSDRNAKRIYQNYISQSHRTYEKQVVTAYLKRKIGSMKTVEIIYEVGCLRDDFVHLNEDEWCRFSQDILEKLAEETEQ